MRTTLTINDDILDQLKIETAKDKSKTFKEVLNETLRLGLRARQARKKKNEFQIESQSMGVFPGLNYDNISELLEHVGDYK